MLGIAVVDKQDGQSTVFDGDHCTEFTPLTHRFAFPPRMIIVSEAIVKSSITSKILIQNVFSPNEDQHNDEWFIKGQNLEKVNIVIYNRWGQKVFETQDIKTAWDGRYLGKELVPDVFGYCVEAYCFGGKKYTLKGNVSLLK